MHNELLARRLGVKVGGEVELTEKLQGRLNAGLVSPATEGGDGQPKPKRKRAKRKTAAKKTSTETAG